MIKDKITKHEFTEEDLTMITKKMGKLIISVAEELKSPDLPVLLALWECANSVLRRINEDHPDFGIQKYMNQLNISQSKHLKEEDD